MRNGKGKKEHGERTGERGEERLGGGGEKKGRGVGREAERRTKSTRKPWKHARSLLYFFWSRRGFFLRPDMVTRTFTA